MEKDKFFVSEAANTAEPIWSSCSFGMEMQSNDLSSCFFNPNWDNSIDQNDPFESALSSIVSSPGASGPKVNTVPSHGGGGETLMIRELIGKLGSICNSDEFSPHPFINSPNNNVSTNNTCYSTPLNSSPKFNLSMMDTQIRGNLPIPGNSMTNHPDLAPFPADSGFAERAVKHSCFGSRNFGGPGGQFGLNEAQLARRFMPIIELGKVSSNNSMKVAGSQSNQESNNSSLQDGNLSSDKKANVEFGESREVSSVSERIPVGELSMKGQNDYNARKRKSIPRVKTKETPSSSPSASDCKVVEEKNDELGVKRSKSDESSGKDKDAGKTKEEQQNGNQKQKKDSSKTPEPPKDCIHVRARRGQATDSHSLAERARRNKISERMKFLQNLVPGCNKVTGRAVMLDEIINYVQSLQRQVKLLSMKLATVNPRMDFNMETLLSKDIFRARGSMPNNLYPLDSSAKVPYRCCQSQQRPPSHNGISSNAGNQLHINPLNSVLRRNPSTHLLPPAGLNDAARPVSMVSEDDLQSVVQMGFGQNQQQRFHGSTNNMTIEH